MDKGITNYNLEAICEETRKIHCLTKADGWTGKPKGKELQMVGAEGSEGNFRGVCGYCNEKCRYPRRDCPKRKAAIANGSGCGYKDKTCNHCSKMEHIEANCWSKHPEKAPKHIQRKMEGGGACVKAMLMNLDVSEEPDFVSACL